MGLGTLYVCGTPIGNLEDISLRVLRVLKEADIIAAEDTRHTLKLLSHYEIKKPMLSYHEHNKAEAGRKIINALSNGKSIALVTDGGMPCVSDPGEDLVRMCIESNLPVTVCPGPTAVVAALALSGLSTSRFVFEGFLPRNSKERREIMQGLAYEQRTLVFYEAPHHLKATLADIYSALGNRPAALLRELTKKFEEGVRGCLQDIIAHYETREPVGEYVLIVAGADNAELQKQRQDKFEGVSYTEHVVRYTQAGISKMEAMKLVARERGVTKRFVYEKILDEQQPAQIDP